MSSPFLDLWRRSLTEVLALKIGLAAGLNRCPHTPAGDVPVLCGCPHDRCAYLREIEQLDRDLADYTECAGGVLIP